MQEELVNIKMRKSDYDFLVDLSKEIKSQDNRITASPYYYVVKCMNEHPTADGCGEIKKVVDEENDYRLFDSREEAKEMWAKEGYYDEDELEEMANKLREYDFKEQFTEENIFFTEHGYNQHMELNSHNYRHNKKFYSYVKHAFRNPEIKKLLEVILRFK